MITTIVVVLLVVLHVSAALTLLVYERRAPSATLAWLLTLCFLPGIGLFFYLLIGRTRARRVRRRYAGIVAALRNVLERHEVRVKLTAQSHSIDARTQSMLALGDRLTSTPASRGNRVDILVDAAVAYPAMKAAAEAARHHIHVEFYIIQPDATGRRMRDLLVERARAGIEVRLVCDGVGSARLPRDFWKPLLDAGGKAAVFRPFAIAKVLARLPWRDRVDFRNHRKLWIVDGRVGFTGGINVGREYLGLDPERGYWRDTHLRIVGPAALSLQKAFAEDWLHASGELLDHEDYFPAPQGRDRGPHSVQVIDSGPDRKYSAISYLFAHAFALARERIWITSPYFIPSAAVEESLIAAALRGIDLRILVPLKPDSRVAMLAASSYFGPLLEAGARIFRYRRGFVHAKTVVVDDWVGTVGSANMDIRSFLLNYEVNAFVYGKEFCDKLAAQFALDLESAIEVKLESELHLAFSKRLLRSAARMMSPLL